MTISNLIGIGLYSVPEASKITGVPSQTISRWIKGYKYKDIKGNKKSTAPVWQSELAEFTEQTTLSFKDLVEVRCIKKFREHNITLPSIRKAYEYVSEELNTYYPFANKVFYTDGKKILVGIESKETPTNKKLINPITKQWNAHEIVSQSFIDSFHYDENNEVDRWHWLNDTVVIDPQRSFGRPILNKEGIPTDILYKSFQVEKDKKYVANIYDIPVSSLNKAIEFEEMLAA